MLLHNIHLAKANSLKSSKRTNSLIGNRSPLVLFIACFVLGILAPVFVPAGIASANNGVSPFHAPYDFTTDLSGLVNCTSSDLSGYGKTNTSSFLDGNLLVDLAISYPNGFAKGKSGIGLKYIAPKSGRIKIDADIVIAGFDTLAS